MMGVVGMTSKALAGRVSGTVAQLAATISVAAGASGVACGKPKNKFGISADTFTAFFADAK